MLTVLDTSLVQHHISIDGVGAAKRRHVHPLEIACIVVSVLDRQELPLDVSVVWSSSLLASRSPDRLHVGEDLVELRLQVRAKSIRVSLSYSLLNFQMSLHVFIENRHVLGPGQVTLHEVNQDVD